MWFYQVIDLVGKCFFSNIFEVGNNKLTGRRAVSLKQVGSLIRIFKDTMKAYFCYRHVIIDYDFEQVILPILKLHICSFNGCSLI